MGDRDVRRKHFRGGSNPAQQKANEAARIANWLYDPVTKVWYTPEEFAAAFAEHDTYDEVVQRAQFMNPMAGLLAGHKLIVAKHAKWNDLSQRILEYRQKLVRNARASQYGAM